MNQLSLFSIDEAGNTVLHREESKPSSVTVNLDDKYKEMIAKLDDYQKAVVEAPAEDSMSCIAGAGCLAGDSIIRVSRAHKGFKVSLKQLYVKFNNIKNTEFKNSWDLSIPTYVRSFNGSHIRLNEIIGVYFSGVKKTYKVLLENGNYLEATADHLFYSKEGYIPVEKLSPGVEIMVDTLSRHKKTSSGVKASKKYYKDLRVGEFYPHKVRNLKRGKLLYRAPEHRLIIEAKMNSLSLKEFIAKTYFPNHLKVLPKETHVHHIDGNTRNNSLNNLQVLTDIQHCRLHSSGYAGFKHGIPEYSKVISVTYIGEQETYDIECKETPNFVANGVVVHNSGKTRTLISRAIKLSYIDKVDPLQIAIITFTNKAANELKERYVDFFKELYPENVTFATPHIATIHSFCLSQIRRTFGFNRTILSEYLSYKLFKDTCNAIHLEETRTAPEIKTVNALYKVYQNMQSNLDILRIGIPMFNEHGYFKGFEHLVDTPKEVKEILLRMPCDRLLGILTGNKETRTNEETLYAYWCAINIRKDLIPKIFRAYMSEKYKNNTLDFSDMDFQYLMLMAQHPELRKEVHRRYLHLMQDESQDSSPAQFLTCLFTDKESFEDFCKKEI